ncbi:hypothetical protein J6590_008226, partial [Homalodisca vitripennis]
LTRAIDQYNIWAFAVGDVPSWSVIERYTAYNRSSATQPSIRLINGTTQVGHSAVYISTEDTRTDKTLRNCTYSYNDICAASGVTGYSGWVTLGIGAASCRDP